MILIATVVSHLGLLKESLLIHVAARPPDMTKTWNSYTNPLHNTLFHSSSLNNFYKPLYRSCLMALLACFIAIFVGGGLAF